MILPIESPLSGPVSAGGGNVAGASTAAIAAAKGSRASGRHDDQPHPDIQALASRPESADSENPGYGMDGHDGPVSDQAPGPVAAGKDLVPAGGVGFIANQIEPDRPDDPILGPLLRKRAAQAYAYSIKTVTRDPLALGVIFDNGS